MNDVARTHRQQQFEKVISEFDERQLDKCVNFAEHRFVSIERDALTANHYAKGHKSLRGACGYLSRATEEGEPLVPEHVLDLDTGEMYELDLFAFVAPKSVDGVALLMPRFLALQLRNILIDRDNGEQLRKLLDQALARRR